MRGEAVVRGSEILIKKKLQIIGLLGPFLNEGNGETAVGTPSDTSIVLRPITKYELPALRAPALTEVMLPPGRQRTTLNNILNDGAKDRGITELLCTRIWAVKGLSRSKLYRRHAPGQG